MTIAADAVARKYVLALLEVAQEQDRVADVGESLRQLQEVMAQNPELLRMASHPGLDDDQKRELLRLAIPEDSPLQLTEFVDMLVAHNQIGILQQAADLYRQLDDERRGIQRAQVEMALPLSEEQRDRLRRALEQIVAGPVRIEEKISAEVIGGLRISMDHTIIDASLRGRLERMQAGIEQAAVSAASS